MKNRLLTAAFSMIVFSAVLTSCTKEKMQPNQASQKSITASSTGSTSSSTASTSSSSGDHNGGCSHGSNPTGN